MRRRSSGFRVPAGAPAFCATLDGMDRPFRVLDGADVVRGVTASWSAATRIMVALAVEHEARTMRVAELKP